MGRDERGFYAVNQVVTSFLFVGSMLLFAFSYAFCGGNRVARFEISDHR